MTRIGVCVAALVLGGALVWLGLATLGEGRAVERTDAALAAPEPPAHLPAGSRTGRLVLGTGDERAAAEAALAYARTASPDSAAAATRAAADAESRLQPVADSGPPARRAWAATLLGVLEFGRAAADREHAKQHVAQSIDALRAAVAADPATEDAKVDLELLLSQRRRQQKQQKQKQSTQRKPRPKPAASSSRAGTGW